MSKRLDLSAIMSANPDLAARNAQLLADARRGKVEPDHLREAAEMVEPKPAGRFDGMNKTERRFAEYLDSLGLAWIAQPFALRLASRTTYTPDFWVPQQRVIYEVKAWWKSTGKPHFEDDARVKLKVASERFAALGQWKAVWWHPIKEEFEYEVF